MKFLTLSILASFALSFQALKAQDANAVPLPDTQSTGPSSTPSAQPSSTPLSLIPEAPQSVPKPSYHGGSGGSSSSSSGPKSGSINPVKKNITAESTEDIASRIKFREAKTKAMKDEKIQEQLAAANSAKNDREKREAMRVYYKLLYAKILKIDGSIKKLVAQRQAASLKQLDQSRVRPEEYDPALATH